MNSLIENKTGTEQEHEHVPDLIFEHDFFWNICSKNTNYVPKLMFYVLKQKLLRTGTEHEQEHVPCPCSEHDWNRTCSALLDSVRV